MVLEFIQKLIDYRKDVKRSKYVFAAKEYLNKLFIDYITEEPDEKNDIKIILYCKL